MRNRINKILLRFSIIFLFVLVFLIISLFLLSVGLTGRYTILLFMLSVISLLPLLKYSHDVIDTKINPISYIDLYAQNVHSILNINSFDEMLKTTFDQTLEVINIKKGSLIFYYHDRDEFNIYYQRNKRKKVIRRARIERDNVLLKDIEGPDDIIIKSKLDPSIKADRVKIDIINKLSGEIIIPIYYHSNFVGLIVIGEKRRFSENEKRLLKILASKIAILSVNSFYFSEILEKKKLEKEYELTSRIQKQFLPNPNLTSGRITIKAHYETVSSMTREFYDIFINKDIALDDVRVSAYRIYGDVKETSILMPGIKAILQSFARLGYSPSKSISTLKKIVKERDALIGDLVIFHSSIKQDGTFIFCNSDYPTPMIFKNSLRLLYPIKGEEGDSMRSATVEVEKGDIIIIACKFFFDLINDNISKYKDIINNNHSLPLDEIKSILVKSIENEARDNTMIEDDRSKVEDKLLILMGMEIIY